MHLATLVAERPCKPDYGPPRVTMSHLCNKESSMAKRASEEVLGELHDMVAQVLLSKLQSGEATPAEINAAIKFLQNNNIEAAMAQEDPALQ